MKQILIFVAFAIAIVMSSCNQQDKERNLWENNLFEYGDWTVLDEGSYFVSLSIPDTTITHDIARHYWENREKIASVELVQRYSLHVKEADKANISYCIHPFNVAINLEEGYIMVCSSVFFSSYKNKYFGEKVENERGEIIGMNIHKRTKNYEIEFVRYVPIDKSIIDFVNLEPVVYIIPK